MSDDTTNELTDRTANGVVDGLSQLFPEPSMSPVFSAPEQIGDEVVITAAAWERVGGFGLGGGGGRDDRDQGYGSGGGGGGTSQARPVAVIRLKNGELTVAPVVDLTKIGVTVLLTALAIWRVLR